MIVCGDERATAPGSFVPSADGASWAFSGGLTFANAAAVLEASRSLPLPSGGEVDMTGLTAADSSTLAVLLALKRRAGAERVRLVVTELPDNLNSLASVYGVDDLVDA